eukprot:TRINITY_DN29027_c0_g1_i2.p1 TRINITY_DN29027_c0_g1~~TRINITY_DN29027_c0_g1_i2.p1  ORF type:complete len:130 (-),score=3.17 TRINITY_DN29027_c0_g1_i2:310-699(-)
MHAPHDPFSASRHVPPPTNVQLATLAHQQHHAGAGGFGGPVPGGGVGAGYAPTPGYGYPMGGGGGMGMGMGAPGMPGGAPPVNPFANPYGPANAYGNMGMAGPPQPTAAAAGGGAGGYQSNPFGNPSLL